MRVNDRRRVLASYILGAAVAASFGTALADVAPPVKITMPSDTQTARSGEAFAGSGRDPVVFY